MQKNNQNIIHSSLFNFEYEDKASALRGNVLIESIFNTQILPELEKAISNKIPKEALVELSKLEINIGNINEKDLATNLASRIRTSLEAALNFKFNYEDKSGTKVIEFDGHKTDKVLIESIELFLVKGYFPFGMEKSVSVDELVKRVIRQQGNDFIKVLKNHHNREQVIQRIVINLKTQTFDEILVTLDPINSNWIFEFREILMNLKKELNFNQYNDAEFIQMMNYSILKFVLNETSLSFSREKFSGYILTGVMKIFKPDSTRLIQAIKNYKGKNSVTSLINKTFDRLRGEENTFNKELGKQHLNAGRLLEILNTGSFDMDSENINFVKDEIILSLRNKAKRKLFIEVINDRGVILIQRLFESENQKEILDLISTYKKKNGGDSTFGAEESINVDEVVGDVIKKSVNELVELLKKYKNREQVIRKIINNLEAQTFDGIMNELEPIESEWIFEFREILLGLKKELNLNNYSDARFIQMMNYSMLKFVLNDSSLNFNGEKFSVYILTEFINIFNPDKTLLIQTVKKYKGSNQVAFNINKTIIQLHEERNAYQKENGNQRLSIGQLITVLNAGSIDLNVVNLNFLKEQIMLVIRDKAKRDLFIERLNESGTNLIQRLFDQENKNEILKLISTFTEGNEGYLAFGKEESFSLNELVDDVIKKSENEIIEILEKHRNREQVVRRIVKNLKTKSFNKILNKLEPINWEWIFEYGEILLNLKKELNLNRLSDAQFIQMINYSTLKYVLNETRLSFSREQFSVYILAEFMDILNPDTDRLIQAIEKYERNNQVAVIANKTILQLHEERIAYQTDDENQRFSIGQLIAILNAGNFDLNSVDINILKEEVILSIRDKAKRELLIKKLNESGASYILHFFDQDNTQTLFKFIHSFSENISAISETMASKVNIKPVNYYVLITILYLHENAIRKLNKEEFLLFLFYSAGIDNLKTIGGFDLQYFLQPEDGNGLDKLQKVIEEEKQFPEIGSIYNILFKSQQKHGAESGFTETDGKLTREYAIIYKRKILIYYLNNGLLPKAYQNLKWEDAQLLFEELIHKKNDFLAVQIRRNDDYDELIARVRLLITGTSPKVLAEYFLHFFGDEYAVLKKTMAEIIRHFTFETKSRIYSENFENEIFLSAIAKSKGAGISSVFRYALLENLNFELANDFRDSTQIFNFLFSKSGETKVLSSFLKKEEISNIDSKGYLKNEMERHFNLLIARLGFTEISPRYQHIEFKDIIKKIAFYAQAYPSLFQIIIDKNRAELLSIYTLFRFYLPVNQWKIIKEMLLAEIEFEGEIEKIQFQSDFVLRKIAKQELDLNEELQRLNDQNFAIRRTFLTMVMNDKVLFEKFYSDNKDAQILEELNFKNEDYKKYFEQLMLFSPGNFFGRLSLKFWNSVVRSFEIQLFLENKNSGVVAFAKAFMSHLLQKLISIQEARLYYFIIAKMENSKSKEVKQLVKLWKTSDKIESNEKSIISITESKSIKDEFDKKDSLKQLKSAIFILKFYAKNGFFPWWTGQITFPELEKILHVKSLEYSEEFEQLFLQSERDEPFFEQLANRISGYALIEFEGLIKSAVKLKAIWEETRQKATDSDIRKLEFSGNQAEQNYGAEQRGIDEFIQKVYNEPDSLLKGLYLYDDKQILEKWLKESPGVAGQVNAYLQLTPYFYFRNITPTLWRKAIYEFSFDFYREGTKPVKKHFHTEFLRYLKKWHTHVNWNEVLKSVYMVVQQPEIKAQIEFPKELVQFLNIKSDSDQIRKESSNMESKFTSENSGVGVKVQNAGIILFWPFLTRLFEHPGLLKNGVFVNTESMNRAVYILQYLAYNEIDFPEYDLVLNKILVGMNLEDHLVPFITLSDEEKNMAQSLINGLISNWEKVKNSSPEGVQETFLQRDGILRFKNEEVFLEVEKKGVDVLIKSIPWNISLIKLSWMKKPIHVEWA